MALVLLHQVSIFLVQIRKRQNACSSPSSLPVGAISAAFIILFLRIPRHSDSSEQSFLARILQLDLIGASILIPAVVCLLLALQWGGATYPWKNSRIIGLFVGFGCLIIIFIYTQIKQGDRATLPPRLLKQRTVAASVCFSVMFGAAFFVLVYFLPLYFQAVKGVSATRSGIEVLPLLLATVISSVVAGILITVFGYYTPFVIGGTALFAIGAGLLTTYKVDMPFGKWFGYQVLTGCGVGVGFQVPIIAVQTVLDLEDIPVATACVIFFQSLGGALFISVAQNVFSNGVVRGVRQFTPWLSPTLLLDAGATEIRNVLSRLGRSADLQDVLRGYMVGLVDVYRVTLACACAAFVASLFFEWRSVKSDEAKRKKEAAEAAGIAA
jgi:hypothetical protein